MFQQVKNYFYERRRTFATAAGVASTVYMVGRYVIERLEEMREEVLQGNRARDK